MGRHRPWRLWGSAALAFAGFIACGGAVGPSDGGAGDPGSDGGEDAGEEDGSPGTCTTGQIRCNGVFREQCSQGQWDSIQMCPTAALCSPLGCLFIEASGIDN